MRERDDGKVEFDDVECVRATPNAILVRIDGDEHRIPQSQIDEDSEIWEEGQTGTLVITAWIAKQKGLV